MLVWPFELGKSFIKDTSYRAEVVLLKLVNSRRTGNVTVILDPL